jgi:hypothetical protein
MANEPPVGMTVALSRFERDLYDLSLLDHRLIEGVEIEVDNTRRRGEQFSRRVEELEAGAEALNAAGSVRMSGSNDGELEQARAATRAAVASVKQELWDHGAELDRLRDLVSAQGTLVAEMMLCRLVDRYLLYVIELLTSIYQTRPETLKCKRQVTWEEVLNHATMDDLVAFIIEEQIEDLSHKGLGPLVAEIAVRPGLDLFPDAADLRKATEIVETRNLIVHNRGIVNRIFKSRVPECTIPVGEPLPLTGSIVRQAILFMSHSSRLLDLTAREKFDLPATQFETPAYIREYLGRGAQLAAAPPAPLSPPSTPT